MARTSVTVTGAKQLQRKLSALDAKIARKVARQSVREGAKVILNQSRSNAPKDSGQLARAIKLKTRRSRRAGSSIAVEIGAGAFKGDTFYGAFVEFGTSKMAAQPFLRPAFEAKKSEAARIIEDHLRTALT